MASELSPRLLAHQGAIVRWVMDDSHQGFFATDAELRIVLWNRWMEIHSGLAAADVLGRELTDVFPDLQQRGMRDYYASALGGAVTILSHLLHGFVLAFPPTIPDAGFAQMPQSGRIGPLTSGGGIVGTATIIEDVSDRLVSEAELRKQIEAQRLARAVAEKALRAKDDFLSTLSHEIRTPLNAVLGWARILLARKEVDHEMLARALQVIERNASAQARMIDDMLDMARIVAGKLRLEMEPVDAVSVVLAAIDVVMPSAQAKGVTVRTDLAANIPRIFGDPDRLQQVVWNLLSNALKFTDSGGTIDVRLLSNGATVRLEVIDSGQGIDSDFLPYLFQRFRQADASSGRRHGGLGLGLALVRDLVGLHGGTVSANSAGPGRGATFTIELPASDTPDLRSHRQGQAVAAATVSLAGVRVLLVEDEPDARELIATALEQQGAAVTAVTSCADALTALTAAPREALPHVIVSDIGMPGEDGYEMIQRVRLLGAERGRIPAVATTGYASAEDVDRTLMAGFQVHLAKPIDPAALLGVVGRLARGSRIDPPQTPTDPASG